MQIVSLFPDETKQEVIVRGLTYPFAHESSAPGTHARVAWEQVIEGDKFRLLRPITRWIDDTPSEIPVGTILRVTSKKRDMAQNNQCRYSIKMQAEGIDGEISKFGCTLLALNTEIITEGMERI